MAFEVVVDPPGVQSADHGLLSGAWKVEQDGDRQRWEGSGIQFLPLPCTAPHGFRTVCDADASLDDLGTDALPKDTVTVYPAGYEVTDLCSAPLVLSNGIDLAGRAQVALGIGVERSIEEELERGTIQGLQDVTLRNDPTVLHGGTAVGPVTGLGLLEDALGNDRGGLGTIHAPTIVVNAWWSKQGVLTEVGPRIETHTKGHIVIAGDGYVGVEPVGETAPGPNQFWVYATGLVVVRLGPVRVFDPQKDRRLVGHRTNSAFGTALQAAMAYHDNCRKFAVLIDLTLTT